jgi:hypothetical protein
VKTRIIIFTISDNVVYRVISDVLEQFQLEFALIAVPSTNNFQPTPHQKSILISGDTDFVDTLRDCRFFKHLVCAESCVMKLKEGVTFSYLKSAKDMYIIIEIMTITYLFPFV